MDYSLSSVPAALRKIVQAVGVRKVPNVRK